MSYEGIVTDWWRMDDDRMDGCWVCGEPTEWIYLDMGFQHPDCDAYPSDRGHEKIVRGRHLEPEPHG